MHRSPGRCGLWSVVELLREELDGSFLFCKISTGEGEIISQGIHDQLVFGCWLMTEDGLEREFGISFGFGVGLVRNNNRSRTGLWGKRRSEWWRWGNNWLNYR